MGWKQVGGKLSQIDTSGFDVWGVNTNYDAFSLTFTEVAGVQTTGSWAVRTTAPRLKRVSMGTAGVWGVDNSDKIYYRLGDSWINYNGLLKDISVGKSEIWGVNSANQIFRKVGSANWARISGSLIQVNEVNYALS